ncbi:hypothetical protein FRC12_022925 [Ceratobasidium sp. 428]|nr:hypothetical protein FRC12_022925 [Ceratobasidium sp. 428]
MSVNITLPPTSQLSGPEEDCETESISEGTGEEETYSDWVDDDAQALTLSLFDDTTHASALKAVAHDKEAHGVDIVELGNQLRLDFLKRVRLINYIRKSKATPSEVLALKPDAPVFSEDAHLRPVIEDDPLLLLGDDEWSDDEDDKSAETKQKQASRPHSIRVSTSD